MHEMSIAWELLQQIDQIAEANDVEAVESVRVEAGVLRGIVPEAMQIAFQEAARGTCAEGAELDLVILPAEACCRLCSARFEPEPDSYLCESCGQADVDLVAGDDIVLSSMTARQGREASPQTDGGSET